MWGNTQAEAFVKTNAYKCCLPFGMARPGITMWRSDGFWFMKRSVKQTAIRCPTLGDYFGWIVECKMYYCKFGGISILKLRLASHWLSVLFFLFVIYYIILEPGQAVSIKLILSNGLEHELNLFLPSQALLAVQESPPTKDCLTDCRCCWSHSFKFCGIKPNKTVPLGDPLQLKKYTSYIQVLSCQRSKDPKPLWVCPPCLAWSSSTRGSSRARTSPLLRWSKISIWKNNERMISFWVAVILIEVSTAELPFSIWEKHTPPHFYGFKKERNCRKKLCYEDTGMIPGLLSEA